MCNDCLPKHHGFCTAECSTAPRRRSLEALLGTDEEGNINWKAAAALTQGPQPGEVDPNKLASIKPPNIPRKAFDADEHLDNRSH